MSRSLVALALVVVASVAWSPPAAGAGPDGQMILAQTVSIAPRWFDPAEAEAIITPYILYYALHDALVKPMPSAAQTRASPSRGAYRRTGSPTSSRCARASASTTATPSPPRT